MSFEIANQGYVILSAFNKAGSAGLTWSKMIKSMTEISTKVFGSNRYVNGPWPLMTTLDDVLNSGEVSENEDGFWAITKLGQRNLKIIRDRDVKPEFPLA